MATVTIGRSYFDALLRRAEFHTTGHEFDTAPSLSNNVTISAAEHTYLLQAVREYTLLKKALFRGGLPADTLETLLSGEDGAASLEESTTNTTSWDETFVRPQPTPVTINTPRSDVRWTATKHTAAGGGLQHNQSHSYNTKVNGYDQPEPGSSIDSPKEEDDFNESSPKVPVNDQRTVMISNLSERTTHKDLVSIIRGGRLLDIFLRNDRTATVSFVEGAADFLAYAKRKDIYLHTKRLEFRWNERQFHVPPHVSNKIATGASRNLVVRGATGKLSADEIRDHLDHIHNLVVVDIQFRNHDAFISTNSIHNALFARTCMMSRTAYKGLRIDWCPDECAAPLPKPSSRAPTPAPAIPTKSKPTANRYTLLDTGSELDSDSEDDSYRATGVQVNSQWSDGIVA